MVIDEQHYAIWYGKQTKISTLTKKPYDDFYN